MKRSLQSIVLLFLFGSLSCGSLHGQFGGGSGTENDPWLIGTAEHLSKLSQYLGSAYTNTHFKQVADISLDIPPWNTGEGWIPIGYESGSYVTRFYGNYDGNGYTIDRLFINRPTEHNQGLFGFTMEAMIVNVTITNASVTGNWYVGGLAGLAWEGTVIQNCTFRGNIEGKYGSGGLVGGLDMESSIERSFGNSVVFGETYSGALAGYAFGSSSVEECASSGYVSGNSHSGGLVGACANGSSINNSSSAAGVGGNDRIGGLVGTITENSVLSFSYSYGQIEGNQYVGGLVGENINAVIEYSFWDAESSTRSISDGGEGKTSAEMKSILTYTNSGWDFKGLGASGIWNISAAYNDNYPVHSWLYPDLPAYSDPVVPYMFIKEIEKISDESINIIAAISNKGIPIANQHGICWNRTGEPTISDNFTEQGAVSAPGETSILIEGLSSNTEYVFRAYVRNDEGLNYSQDYYYMIVSQPVGDGTEESPFQISKIGDLLWMSSNKDHWNKHYLQVDDIDATSTFRWNNGEGWSPVGTSYDESFRGHYDGGGHTISGLYINRPSTKNQALFGFVRGASLSNLKLINADITAYDNVGGLVGNSDNVIISTCMVSGTITGHDVVGGLIGSFGGSTTTPYEISECYTEGMVSGNRFVGGFTGLSGYYSGITNCYSRSSVSGDDRVGGIAGGIQNTSALNKCYSSGSVSGNSSVGGLLGYILGSSVTSCFWDTESSGQATSAGGIGKTTVLMKETTTFAEASWDFTEIWHIDAGLNQGYPFLKKLFPASAEDATLATISTAAVGSISQTTASSGGSIIFGGNTHISQKGVVWGLTTNPTLEYNTGYTVDGDGLASFTSEITGLTHSTEYFVRAYAKNFAGVSYGEELSFTTLMLAPVSDFTADFTSGFAPLEVSFSDLSTGEPVSWSWDFGDGASSEEQDPTHVFSSKGSYDVTLSTTNPGGSHTVTRENFILVIDQISLPEVSTAEVSEIGENNAISGGTVIAHGGSAVTARGIFWSSEANPSISEFDGMTSDGQGLGMYVSTLSGLLPNTTYYVRAYATNAVGTAYGVEVEFITEGTGIETVTSPKAKVYPLPFDQYFTVVCETGITSLHIYDIYGSCVSNKLAGGEKQLTLSAESISSGVYFLMLIDNNDEELISKIVKK